MDMITNQEKKYVRNFKEFLTNPLVYGDLMKAYQVLNMLNDDKKPKEGNTNTVVCTQVHLSDIMGITRNYARKLLNDLVEFKMIEETGETVNIKGMRVPVYSFPDIDGIKPIAKPKRGIKKKTEHNQLNNNDMGNFIGTLEDLGLQGTEPVIARTNGEQEKKAAAEQVIQKQETIVKKEPEPKEEKTDEPPTIRELLEPYKEYLDPKVPFDEIPRHVMDEIVKNGLENHFVYIRKGWDISGLGYPRKKS